MVSKVGKDSFGGYSLTPFTMPAFKEQLEIVQYLVKTCTTVDLIGQTNSMMVIIVYIMLHVFKEECSNAPMAQQLQWRHQTDHQSSG